MGSIKNLTEIEEKALRHFLARVAEQFGDNYRFSIMFGSKARGDYHPESDIDVAVVMKEVDFRKKCSVYDLAADEMLETEVEISPLVFSEADFERYRRRNAPILSEIERDKVLL